MSARYIVHHGDKTIAVTLSEEGEGFKLDIENETVHVDHRTIDGGPHRSIIVDGQSYEADTMPTRDGTDVYVSGDVFHVKVTDELWARAEAAAQSKGAGYEEVLAPMPGAVVDIPVSVGQVIAPGETVVVVEAMKMQNDIATVGGGKVTEIRKAAGDVVDQGMVLLVLGPAGEADG